jgi:4-amino-4-deoxy-L-arabinose transferase-like glycosyltransferase
MNQRLRLWFEIAIVIALCAFLYFYRLDAFGLVGADEPRYAQVAREMLQKHDWVTPILYGQPWLEKPILYYWRAMIAYTFFGINDFAARLPSATLAAFLIVVTYFWARRFRPGVQLNTALILAASTMMIGFGRAASTDMSLAAPFCAAMLCWWGWHQTDRKWWLVLFYALMGLGMLAKGPVAPGLAGLIIIAYALVIRNAKLVLKTLWMPGILVFLLVAMPWYIEVQLKTPQFFRVFFLEHNLERFGTNMFRHKQPFWYYLPVFLVAVLPWTTYVIAAIYDVFRDRHFRRENNQDPGDGLPMFLLLWTVVPIAFFTVSQSKLPGYILPAIPPALILAAEYIHHRMTERESPNIALLAIHAVLSAIMIGALLIAPAQMAKVEVNTQMLVSASLVSILVLFGILLLVFVKGLEFLRFATLIPVILGVAFILRNMAPLIDATQSERPVAARMASLGVATNETVATFKARREVEYGLAWYRNQPIRSYERLEIPSSTHVVVTRAGSESELRELLPGREVKLLGEYTPQGLEFFSVGSK